MGADVIKVERLREGDWQRNAGPGEPDRFGNPQLVALNCNRRDIGINLNDNEGPEGRRRSLYGVVGTAR